MPKLTPYHLSWDEENQTYVLREMRNEQQPLFIASGNEEWLSRLNGIPSFIFIEKHRSSLTIWLSSTGITAMCKIYYVFLLFIHTYLCSESTQFYPKGGRSQDETVPILPYSSTKAR